MGSTRDDFVKYPRTPHLFGSKGTDDDKHLGESDSQKFISNSSLIIEEKMDGTNVGIHFSTCGQLVLQCRGHLITEGMHPQYDLFKQWTTTKKRTFEDMLGDTYILFGEWVFAKHSIHYTELPHYFFEFDIYDKVKKIFLTLEQRLEILQDTGIQTVPVLHRGSVSRKRLEKLVGQSQFGSLFENPLTHQIDHLMEGLYLRTEEDGAVSGRAKFVRPEFVEKVKQSTHWQQQRMVENILLPNVDIWS